MSKVNDLSVSRLVNGDFYQFIENIVSIATTEPLTSGVLQTLANDVPNLLNSYQKEKLTLETQKIVDLDLARDRAYIKFKSLVEAHAFDDAAPANIQASAKLQTFIDLYGSGQLVKFDYHKETANLTALVDDVRTKAASEMELLNLSDTVDYLETCNNDFKTFYASRGDAASALANVVPFYKLRKEVAVHYKTFTADLESLQRFMPSNAAQISDLITRLNIEIDKFKLLIPSSASSNGHTTEVPTV